MQSRFKTSLRRFKKALKEEDVRFRLLTSLKMTLVPLLTFMIMGGLISIVLKMDLVFFKANGLLEMNSFEETYYEYIFHKLIELLPYLGVIIIFVYIAGLYVSDFLLRPFREISRYCEQKMENKDCSYNPEFLSELKLLTTFSEFFFSITESAEKNNGLPKVSIPKKYSRIRKPVFETAFFINFSLYIIISMILTSLFVYVFTVDLHDGLITLAQQTLTSRKEVQFFLEKQDDILETVTLTVVISHLIVYSLLSFHLYKMVSTPAFGVFATMRAFLNGKYNSRVHLIGFSYLRAYCRNFNKYLDQIESRFVKNTSAECLSKAKK